VEGVVAVPRRTLEEARKCKGELNNTQSNLWSAVVGETGGGKRRCTCNELPVWNAHQTNMAEKDTASLCDTELSDREKRKEDG
jgi:hypothetical protein